ncbi:hypothetical protein Lalb_Chr13g0292281 [Lupinus albus]|uniref:Uncharacterized protein n=1 Tax=Lupinus albus TaxID=3870 RepID=A0A6A4PHC5_LUPAL|nr:hypothetical protein Lalb_Chr13g0292281 [Lupinus albus]
MYPSPQVCFSFCISIMGQIISVGQMVCFFFLAFVIPLTTFVLVNLHALFDLQASPNLLFSSLRKGK